MPGAAGSPVGRRPDLMHPTWPIPWMAPSWRGPELLIWAALRTARTGSTRSKGASGQNCSPHALECMRDNGDNPFAAAVDVHTPEEYENCRMFLTDDGRAGFAIAEGDELVSVFSCPGKHAGGDVVAKAVELGARRLDCYDIHGALPRLYGSHGFKPIAYVDWDDDYAPDGWDYGTLGRPACSPWPSPTTRPPGRRSMSGTTRRWPWQRRRLGVLDQLVQVVVGLLARSALGGERRGPFVGGGDRHPAREDGAAHDAVCAMRRA